MRLIDADRLKSYIDCGHLRPPTEVCFSELDVCNMIDKAPTVSADRPKGEWLDVHEDGHSWFVAKCSQCGKTNRINNYCPNCGAEMRHKGGDDE